MLCRVHVLFENIIMPINKRYQVVRNWKSKATCENMFTTTTSCVISLDVSVKWDYPMHQNKIEGKNTDFIYSLYAWEILCLKWLACKSHFILFLFIVQTNVYIQDQLSTQNFVWDIFFVSDIFWIIWNECKNLFKRIEAQKLVFEPQNIVVVGLIWCDS